LLYPVVLEAKKQIEQIGLQVLEPFEYCGKKFDYERVEKLKRQGYYSDVREYMIEFGIRLFNTNLELMEKASIICPILDGGRESGEGISWEIGYCFGKYGDSKPIHAIRTDFRPGESIATSVNEMTHNSISKSGGSISESLHSWYRNINGSYRIILNNISN
jgi:nucleoside 2-deoxyribosyltransferase